MACSADHEDCTVIVEIHRSDLSILVVQDCIPLFPARMVNNGTKTERKWQIPGLYWLYYPKKYRYFQGNESYQSICPFPSSDRSDKPPSQD